MGLTFLIWPSRPCKLKDNGVVLIQDLYVQLDECYLARFALLSFLLADLEAEWMVGNCLTVLGNKVGMLAVVVIGEEEMGNQRTILVLERVKQAGSTQRDRKSVV